MRAGTTPTYRFSIPFNVTGVHSFRIDYSQDGEARFYDLIEEGFCTNVGPGTSPMGPEIMESIGMVLSDGVLLSITEGATILEGDVCALSSPIAR